MGQPDLSGANVRPAAPSAQVRRLALWSLVRSLGVGAALTVGYFVLPMTSLDNGSLLLLAGGLLVVAVLLAWQVRDVARSPFPRVRAAGALATSTPLFFLIFATTYFVMESTMPGSFSEKLTKLDALYFTITVFATVGFGDITGVSEVARAVVTVQMLGDLLIVGLVARALFQAMQEGLEHLQDR